MKDIDRFKSLAYPTQGDLLVCLSLLYLLVDVTVDLYPAGLLTSLRNEPLLNLDSDIKLSNN